MYTENGVGVDCTVVCLEECLNAYEQLWSSSRVPETSGVSGNDSGNGAQCFGKFRRM